MSQERGVLLCWVCVRSLLPSGCARFAVFVSTFSSLAFEPVGCCSSELREWVHSDFRQHCA